MTELQKVESAFSKLLGRTPTDGEKVELYRLKDELGLSNDDAVWLIFLGMQYHLALYREVPGLIVNAVTKASQKARKEIAFAGSEKKIMIQNTASELIGEMGFLLREVAEKEIRRAASKTKKAHPWAWALAFLAALLLLVGGGVITLTIDRLLK